MDTHFICDVSRSAKDFPHFREHTIGSGHAPLALRADWQRQMRRCREELGFGHVRFHGLLCDDMGTLVRENGQLLYSFFNVDADGTVELAKLLAPLSVTAITFYYAGLPVV